MLTIIHKKFKYVQKNSIHFVHTNPRYIILVTHMWFTLILGFGNYKDRYRSLQTYHINLLDIIGLTNNTVTYWKQGCMVHATCIYWILFISWKNMFRKIVMKHLGHWTQISEFSYIIYKHWCSYCVCTVFIQQTKPTIEKTMLKRYISYRSVLFLQGDCSNNCYIVSPY